MKVYPRSNYDKKKCRNANYEYMAEKKPVTQKDFLAKIAFERKPYFMKKESEND
jgi:hypothetical protein